MRKFILTVVLAGFSTCIFAQSLDDIQKTIYVSQKWEDAKGMIDKFLAQEKNSKNAKGWYYKGLIYSELAKQEKYAGTTTRMDAFEAFKKYQELDPKNSEMKDGQNGELFVLYNNYFDDAVSKYNLKKYDEALQSFKGAMSVEEYIHSKSYSYNGFTFAAVDTQLIQNAALAAYLGKKNDEAAFYYQKLADAKIGGENFLEVYQFLVDYYGDKKDAANRSKYTALGRELYPTNDYWCDAELKYIGPPLKDATDSIKQKFARYDELINGTCNTFPMHYNYAAELFNYLYTGDKKPSDYVAMQAKLESVINKLFTIKKNAPEADLLMARHMYNQVFDIQDSITAIKGTKPDDVKKKTALLNQMNKKYDELLPYAAAVEDMYAGKSGLKNSEKNNLKVADNLILSYWENKKDAAKVKEYSDKMKAVDNQ